VQTLLSMTLARHPNFSVYTQVSKADLFDFFGRYLYSGSNIASEELYRSRNTMIRGVFH
jgi:hypothetical protein